MDEDNSVTHITSPVGIIEIEGTKSQQTDALDAQSSRQLSLAIKMARPFIARSHKSLH